MYYTNYNSKFGEIVIVSDGESILELFFKEQKHFDYIITKNVILKNNIPILNETCKWLDRYFNKENPSIKELPLKFVGTNFRKLVWNLLLDIPYGGTTTYLYLANRVSKILNKKMSAQAIGGAVGHNPIAIIVPCHRVIGTNGDLTGYAYGLDIKKKLLDLEKNNI